MKKFFNTLTFRNIILKSVENKEEYEIIGIIEDIAIVKLLSKVVKFQTLVYNEKDWILIPLCWPTIDYAILNGIAFKYEENLNSKFPYYIGKMLGMNDTIIDSLF